MNLQARRSHGFNKHVIFQRSITKISNLYQHQNSAIKNTKETIIVFAHGVRVGGRAGGEEKFVRPVSWKP